MAKLIKSREQKINNLRLGLSKTAIKQKTAALSFEFPQELYELYQWRNGIDKENADLSPFLFRDCYLSNLDDALETYFNIQTWFDNEEDRKIADWSRCFPFANFDGSYLLILLGNHILIDEHRHPIVNVFEGTHCWFYSFDSMLKTCIEWNQQSFEKYSTPKNEIEIWEKHNPGIFDIDL